MKCINHIPVRRLTGLIASSDRPWAFGNYHS
jgi:hypothetical protein